MTTPHIDHERESRDVMSSKTRKPRTTAGTNGSATTLRSVPEQIVAAKVRTDTEDKLWEALHAKPNSTAADLSGAVDRAEDPRQAGNRRQRHPHRWNHRGRSTRRRPGCTRRR
jgi:hypothetical protein